MGGRYEERGGQGRERVRDGRIESGRERCMETWRGKRSGYGRGTCRGMERVRDERIGKDTDGESDGEREGEEKRIRKKKNENLTAHQRIF